MCRTFIYIAISFVVGIAFGWWLGSLKEPIEIVREEVRYVELPPITKVIEKPVPVRETIYVRDTVRENEDVVIQADTAAIIADYLQRREYDLDFSSDTVGTFKVNAVVEANHLSRATATIIPLQREIKKTVVKVQKFRPYISGGIAIGDKIGVSLKAGAIVNENHIFSGGYMRLGSNNYFTGEYGFVFGKKRKKPRQ